MKKLFPLLILLSIVLHCTQEEGSTTFDVVDLIPGDGDISGWTRNGAMEIAENETQLWGLINGEGVVYLENGFVKCAFQEFAGTVQGNLHALDVRAFDMGDTLNAAAVYHDDYLATPGKIPWTDPGHPGVEAREEIIGDFYRVEFWQSRFYVDITIDNASMEAQDFARLFALNISGTISRLTGDPEN